MLPLVVHDFKVLSWRILNCLQYNREFISDKNVDIYIKSSWAWWLNSGPDMLNLGPHTFFCVSDKKGEEGYWRNYEISRDLRMTPLYAECSSAEYKGNRGNKPNQEMFTNVEKIGKKYAEKYGIPIFEKENFEADDFAGVIYRLFKNEEVPKRKVYLHTIDRDWSQLVDNYVGIYWANVRHPKPKEVIQNRLAEESDVIEHTEHSLGISIYHPSQLAEAKSIKGDMGDNLPSGSPIEYFDLCNPHPIYKIEDDKKLYQELKKWSSYNQDNTRQDHKENAEQIIKKLKMPFPSGEFIR